MSFHVTARLFYHYIYSFLAVPWLTLVYLGAEQTNHEEAKEVHIHHVIPELKAVPHKYLHEDTF